MNHEINKQTIGNVASFLSAEKIKTSIEIIRKIIAEILAEKKFFSNCLLQSKSHKIPYCFNVSSCLIFT
jgi:hypothetical protein